MILKPRLREEPEIQLIPLVDVVLLLLIFFMVSSTFSFEGRVKLQLPQADAPTERPTATDPIIVTVTAQGAYRVNELTLINNSQETLRGALLKAAGPTRKVPVTIRADARATHQSVVTAMDVIGRLGYGELRIKQGNETKRFYVDGGFAQVRANVVTVLTSRALKTEEIKADVVRKALEAAMVPGKTAELQEAQLKAQERARAQLRLVNRT